MPNCVVIQGQQERRKVSTCEHLVYCQQIEPLGLLLPCESPLAFEKSDNPEPPSKPRGRGKYIHADRVFDFWPEGQRTITIVELAEKMGFHETTARRYLEKAVDLGLVEKYGQDGKANLYHRIEGYE